MKHFVLVLLVLMKLYAHAQSAQEIKRATEKRDKYLFSVTTDRKNFDEKVVPEFVSDALVVPVAINGKTYTFLFDTGAVTILSPALLKELGLSASMSNPFVDSAGNTSDQNFYIVPEIALGNVKFQNIGAGCFDLAKFSELLCRPIDGIFGSNMMRTCNWEIDYDAPSIRFSSAKIALENAASVPFEQNFSGTPRIRLDTSGINFLADVDTGNNGSLDMPFEFFEKSRLTKSNKIATSRGKGSYSLMETAEQDEFAVLADSIALGKMRVSRRIRVSPSPMVLIGNDFFSPMGKFVINYKNSELLLPKKPSAPKPETTFGFAPMLQNGKVVVVAIWKHSEAEKQGLAISDELLSVDGVALDGLSAAQWCEFRMKIASKDSLAVVLRKPDGTMLRLTLAKYDVLD